MTSISRAEYADCSARPPATGSAWPTPNCSSRSSATCASRGDEAVYGGGKTIRDGMGQDNRLTQRRRRAWTWSSPT